MRPAFSPSRANNARSRSYSEGFSQYDFIRKQTKDKGSLEEMQFPAEYMFRNVPKDLPTSDPVAVTLHEMDRFGIELGMIGTGDDTSRLALKKHPDRFVPDRLTHINHAAP